MTLSTKLVAHNVYSIWSTFGVQEKFLQYLPAAGMLVHLSQHSRSARRRHDLYAGQHLSTVTEAAINVTTYTATYALAGLRPGGHGWRADTTDSLASAQRGETCRVWCLCVSVSGSAAMPR